MLLTPEQFQILYNSVSQPVLWVQSGQLVAQNPAAQELLPPDIRLLDQFDLTSLQAPGFLSFQLGDKVCSAMCQPLEDGALLFLSTPTQEPEPTVLARAAHALSIPLTTLLSASGMIFSQLSGHENPVLRKTFAAAYRACYQLLRLQENINAFCAAQRGPLPLNRERLDLCAFLSSLQQTVGDACRLAGHELTLDIPQAPVYVLADARQLRRALLALVSNAIKFTQPNAPLHLSLTRSPRRALLRLCDNGEGMDPSILNTVFSRYRRPLTLEDPRFGSGFSLPAVQAIVQAHGGTLLLRSKKNAGTDLLISLPISTPKDQLILRSPRVTIDRSGGFVPELVELSDVLPVEAFDRSKST